MDIICNYLKHTYNTNILEKIDEENTLFFKKISKYFKNKNIGNSNLLNLIYNHYYAKKPIADFLEGPHSLTYHTSIKYNMNIYCFGERHSFDLKCPKKSGSMKCSEYISKLIDSTDVFLDIFVEIPRENINYNSSVISDLSKMDCSPHVKRNKKKCNLVRVHYIDIRRETKFTKNNDGMKSFLSLRKSLQKNENIEGTNLDYFRKISSMTLSELYNHFSENISKSLYYTNKEVNKSLLRNKIQKFINLELYNVLKKNYKIVDILTSISSIIIDMYFLSRLFKIYNIKSNNQPQRSYNVIVYTGTSHSNRYRRFFNNEMKFVEEEKYIQKNLSETCIDMKNISQPFFKKL